MHIGRILAATVQPPLNPAAQALEADYYFNMFYDDLPIWGFIGKVEKIQKPAGMEKRYHLFTHGGCSDLSGPSANNQ